MILVDSHCHLDCLDFSESVQDLANYLKQAEDAYVRYLLCVCITQEDFQRMSTLVEPYRNVFLSVGTHPNEILDEEITLEDIVSVATQPRVIAIGETGLDYYRSEGDMTWQQERFRRHIRAAKAVKKPLIVHSRQARNDTITILRDEHASDVGGVMHCFTESLEMAEQAIELNFYISFSGIITFSNATDLQEVVKKVPLEKILIETDSPYLAPVPFRGKSNQPAYVRYVAEKLAELKQISVEEVAEKTTENFFKLFSGAKRDE